GAFPVVPRERRPQRPRFRPGPAHWKVRKCRPREPSAPAIGAIGEKRARLRLFSEPDVITDGFFVSCPALPQLPLCCKEQDAQTALQLFVSLEQTSSDQWENLQPWQNLCSHWIAMTQ
ncbi:hypothetical protein DV515_00015401, partial [Chloebia gouldiae]